MCCDRGPPFAAASSHCAGSAGRGCEGSNRLGEWEGEREGWGARASGPPVYEDHKTGSRSTEVRRLLRSCSRRREESKSLWNVGHFEPALQHVLFILKSLRRAADD